jgi:hypothetical protein
MNWKLILQLSMFGLAMAIATISWIPSSIEPLFWAIIFLFCAYLIAKKCQGKYFLYGFLVSIVNMVWMILVHIIFYNNYIANHPDLLQFNGRMVSKNNPVVLMLITGLIWGILSGLVLGLFAFFENKILNYKVKE